MSRPQPAAVNAVVAPVVTYAPDPRGAGMVAALQGRIAGSLNGARAVIERWPTWGGYSPTVQQFRGFSVAGAGRARAMTPTNSDIGQEKTALTDPALRIFADRMAQGR